MRRRRRRIAPLLAAACLLAARPASGAPARASGYLTDVTEASGLPSLKWTWPPGTYALPEIMGPGVALFDFDGDGRLDILQIAIPPPGSNKTDSPGRLWKQG